MEIEPTPQMIAKRLWRVVRIVFYMLKKGMTKTKIMLDLHMIFKRGKIASKAMAQIMHHLHQDYSSFACNSTDVRMSIVPLREYEFSCSDTPSYPSYFSKLKNHHHRRSYYYGAEDMNLARKVFDVLSRYDSVEASPLVSLPGFGQSPLARQLRVTDSPFSVRDSEETPQVDRDCEEFIKKIRKELKQQEMMASIESPSPYHRLAR